MIKIETQKKLIWFPIVRLVVFLCADIAVFRALAKKQTNLAEMFKFSVNQVFIALIISVAISIITSFVEPPIIDVLLRILNEYLVFLVWSYFNVDLQEDLNKR